MTERVPLKHVRLEDGHWCVEAEIFLPRPRDEIFAFFQDAYNLELLTPDFLRFEVLTPRPIEMKVGALIEYRLRLHGIPIGWRTEISEWNPPYAFVDEQLKGPYRRWHHTHEFIEKDGGTLCKDRVLYKVFGGAFIQRFFVKKDVETIFAYRTERLRALFGAP